MTDDLAFTFDTSFFNKGIQKIMKGFSTMENRASSVAKSVSRGLMNVVGKLGIIVTGFKAIKSALLGMPEVAQAFGIAKDVFFKNLLYPLRKEIFPLLQKMLDWIRDSRVRFVKWGQHLANIFRAVVSGVKTIISFVKKMSEGVARIAEKIFGDRIKNIDEIFNLITFKIAVVIQFISILIENIGGLFSSFFSGLGDIGKPLKGIIENLFNFVKIFTEANDEGNSFKEVLNTMINLFGKIVGFVVQMTDKFLDGFVPAIENIMTPIQRIVDAFDKIFEAIFGSDEQLKTWGDLFEKLGTIVGVGLLKSFEIIATIVETIADVIDSIKEIGFKETIKVGFEKTKEAVTPWIEEAKVGVKTIWKKGLAFLRGETEIEDVDDAIIKPDGTVIKTNPKDTLIAMKDENKSFSGLFGNTSIEMLEIPKQENPIIEIPKQGKSIYENNVIEIPKQENPIIEIPKQGNDVIEIPKQENNIIEKFIQTIENKDIKKDFLNLSESFFNKIIELGKQAISLFPEKKESVDSYKINNETLNPGEPTKDMNLKDDKSLSGLINKALSTTKEVVKNLTTNIDFSGMQIVVQEGGTAEGQELAMGLIDQMRNEYNRDFERFGF